MPTRCSRSFVAGEDEVASFLDLPPIPGPDAMRAHAEARARAADQDLLQNLRRRRRKRVNDLNYSSPLAIRDTIFNEKCCKNGHLKIENRLPLCQMKTG